MGTLDFLPISWIVPSCQYTSIRKLFPFFWFSLKALPYSAGGPQSLNPLGFLLNSGHSNHLTNNVRVVGSQVGSLKPWVKFTGPAAGEQLCGHLPRPSASPLALAGAAVWVRPGPGPWGAFRLNEEKVSLSCALNLWAGCWPLWTSVSSSG